MEKVLLIGTGRMARAYLAVLQALGRGMILVGRSEEGASAFQSETGVAAHAGGLARYVESGGTVPETAIIAVDAPQLAVVAEEAVDAGCRSLLLEKPGALRKEELVRLKEKTDVAGASVVIAYNRRYLASVLKAKELVKKMGGALSFTFEFNERVGTFEILRELHTEETLARWFFANSTHVVDLAFYLGGTPRVLEGFSAVGSLWRPHPSFFSGAGITKSDVPFSYRANWELPGPWDVVIGTREGNLVLRPLEALSIEKDGKTTSAELDDTLDTQFKPGFYRQVETFLAGDSELPTLAEQVENFRWYERMLGEHASLSA